MDDDEMEIEEEHECCIACNGPCDCGSDSDEGCSECLDCNEDLIGA